MRYQAALHPEVPQAGRPEARSSLPMCGGSVKVDRSRATLRLAPSGASTNPMTMRIAQVVPLLWLCAAPAHAAPVPLPSEPTVLVASLGVAAVYADHPLVAEVASRRWLSVEQRATLLYTDLAIDRAWAVVDAIGAAGVAQHAQDRAMLLAVAARAQVGPSGAIAVADVRTSQLDARGALLFGWVRALVGDRAALLRTSERLQDAGALQLLALAQRLQPNWQATQLALAVVQAAAVQRPQCGHAAAVQRAARHAGSHAVRLAVAENADRMARGWVAQAGGPCATADQAELRRPIALPPPPPESEVVRNQRPPPPPDRGEAPPGDAFVAAAPVFRGWLDDPAVRKLVLRTPLDEPTLFALLQQDPSGDRTLAAINAAYHARRTGAFNLGDLTWRAVVRAQGLAEVDPAQQARLKLVELKPQQAMVLAYGLVLGSGARAVAPGTGLALQATVAELVAAARGGLPLDAKLGPVLALAHFVDSEPVPCKAARRAEALRVTLAKTDLPMAAQQALLGPLRTVEQACPAAAAVP